MFVTHGWSSLHCFCLLQAFLCQFKSFWIVACFKIGLAKPFQGIHGETGIVDFFIVIQYLVQTQKGTVVFFQGNIEVAPSPAFLVCVFFGKVVIKPGGIVLFLLKEYLAYIFTKPGQITKTFISKNL